MTTKWNGKINSLVVSEDSNPELYEELARISHRERSIRFRTLALIGLFALRNQAYPQAAAHPLASPSDQDSSVGTDSLSPRLENKKAKLAAKLLGSVQTGQ